MSSTQTASKPPRIPHVHLSSSAPIATLRDVCLTIPKMAGGMLFLMIVATIATATALPVVAHADNIDIVFMAPNRRNGTVEEGLGSVDVSTVLLRDSTKPWSACIGGAIELPQHDFNTLKGMCDEPWSQLTLHLATEVAYPAGPAGKYAAQLIVQSANTMCVLEKSVFVVDCNVA